MLFPLIVLMAGLQLLQAQEPAKKVQKKTNPKQSFEYRFDDNLKQTADSKARQELWFRDAKFGAFIHFGVYYSHAQDWDEPDAPYLNKRAKLREIHPDLPADFQPDMDRYIMKKSLPQVEELVKNYELDNNGPMGSGRLDPEAVRLYGVIGDWLKVNGESIYGSVRNPLDERPEWGDISASKDGKTLYLHILEWPESGSITVNGLSSTATSAVYLASGERADCVQENGTLKITLPAQPLDEYDTVVKVSF